MAQIIWTETALIDLDEIAEYIALDKPGAARALIRDVFENIERLANFPRSGRVPPEMPRKSRYREVVVGPCRVFYRTEKDNVYILHVLRSERLLRQFMLMDGELEKN